MPDNSGRSGSAGGTIEISCRYLLDLLCYANQGSYKYLKILNDKGKNNERKRKKNTKKHTNELYERRVGENKKE
jgi:hypothetical protein